MLIKIDTHCHSLASTHAYSTIKEMAESAKEIGLKGFALTDHAVQSPDAPHMWHFHNLKCLPREINGVKLIRGVEANVLDAEGNIDMYGEHLKYIEWIVASMHSSVMGSNPEKDYTNAYIKLAKEHNEIDVIGHPTTILFPFDYEKTLKVFKEYNKFPEINESSIIFKKGSKENAVSMLKICKKYDIPVVVNTDAHYCGLLGKTDTAQQLIEQTGFPKKLIFNAEIDRVLEHISAKHGIDFSNNI